MRCAPAFLAVLLLVACSRTAVRPAGSDASDDLGSELPDAQPDSREAEEPESRTPAPDADADGAPDRPVKANDAAVDLPPPPKDASLETQDWLCPGHREPCFAGVCSPYLRIATTDSSASITSVRTRSGGCVIRKIATTVGGDLRFVDGGFQAVAAVAVLVDSTCVPAADCDFEVWFANGASTVITSRYSQGGPVHAMFCTDNANCCPPSLYVDTVGYPCDFWPREFVLDVPAGIDGGGPVIDGGSAQLDGSAASGQ